MSVGFIRRVAGLVSSVLMVAALGAPAAAQAAPLNADPAAGSDVTLPWRTLGLPGDVTLVGADANQDFSVPVPNGFAAVRLRGLIHAPVDFGAGFVEISDSSGTFLGTVNLPAVAPEQAVVPFDIDISPARVRTAELGLSFAVREAPRPATERCGLGERVRLSDLAVVYAGIEPAPTTVATFFPAVLQRLTIYAPIDADDAEEQAVLTLASAVARMYRPQSPVITVVKHPRGATPPEAPQFTRAVVVENGDAALNVVNPDRPDVYLELNGRGDQLAAQASLVANQLQSLVQVPEARVDKAGSDDDAGVDEVTFDDLDMSGESSVLRTSTMTVGVDRAALGAGRVEGLRVHLLATHTPVQPMDSASLMVSVNGRAVHTTPLRENGRVDAVFDVPGEDLDQRINLEFDLTFSPRQLCSPTIAPLTFELDPQSTLTIQRGGPPLTGFGALPSEFSPEFLVALDGSNPNQLHYATRVIADIARLTDTPLVPRVVDVKAAADARIGALIVANAATVDQTSIRPPVGGESAEVQIDLGDELRADITSGLGSIQAFADEPRDRAVVLVTTSGAWTLVEPLFGYIDQLPDGWSSLDGDVLAAGAAGDVTNLSIGADDTAAPPPQNSTDTSVWVALGAGAAVLAALAVAAAWFWRRRRGAARTHP
ncbi:hypothetical protein E4P42_07170 [Mycobacterium sp. PS03-16]|uniref:cellulose biosynthesis cyclic di-GMP-binding regulatory protein BcsB n=1 Tax=Mycobacterium sp. PS03-16 TaxID=2559611 RepID=UPI001072FD47|nr:cellulose biosynthesis cyclic di-GMP-binding regulatory protein BcsB [Mycobacterium sp. PS03-16]TFV59670.1 hypothetical protein E4P42_07170 [Mycobacterium sp. PS03-16]